jgi:fibronectin-binding autotransporter adhesin
MRMQLVSLLRKSFTPGLMATALMACSAGLYAQSGTWTSTVDGLWSSGGNWAGGTIADGANNTANFNTLDISDQTGTTGFPAVGVELDSPRTIGHMIFGDTNAATPGAWDIFTLTQATNILTLSDATKPTITVNPLGPVGLPPAQDAARVLVDLAGTQGFTKLGAGVLTLQGTAGTTITGGININEGMLRVSAAIPAQTFTIANGATLNPTVSMDAVGTRIFSVASGATANLSITNSVEVGRFDAVGANINVNFPATNYPGGPAIAAGARFTPSGNWLASGAANSPATFVVNSSNGTPTPTTVPVTTAIPQTGAVVRLAPNLSSASGGIRNFNGNTFATTAVTLNNTLLYSRTNSGGNTFNFGSLTGDSTAILSGGIAGAFANYSIGALNVNTSFAGTIDNGSATAAETTGADTGGLNLTKVGTGTLTLSGTLAYQPTGNGTVNRRGGITTVSAGTLALTNSAAIPGGIVHGTVGNVLSTVNILSGATLDVSGFSGSYSSANLQQIVGAGTVVGNFTHDEGVIRPANTINGTTASGTSPSVAVGGTINFANNFTWSGGEYTYDTTLDPNVGNDLISVAGTATLTSGVVTPNFLGGIPTTGTYTLLTAGSISGSAAGITVAWPGRAADPIPFIDGNSLKVSAPGLSSGNLTWVGNNGPNWDIETTANWTGANPNTFFQSDNVTFDDTATSYAVTVVGNVQPSSVTVNNSTNAYTISGTGAIGGASTFSKTGAGLLTMTTANTFSGAASITGGTVSVENAGGALGTGPLTLSNAQLNSNNSGSGGITNSSLTIPAGTTSTVRANKSVTTTVTWFIPTLAGDGTLNLTSESLGQIIDFSATANTFTGVLNLVGATDTDGIEPLVTVNTTVYRMNSASSSMPNAEVNLTNGASLRDRATSAQTLTLGALSGDATATLFGYQGGSGATARTWEIGGLGTNTTFAGVIQDSAGSGATTAPVTLNKVGTGELELTGLNTYTGNTTVDAGTLSITNPYLADLADITVSTGALLDLNFVGTDTISDLILGGLPRAIGEWGGPLSGAANISSLLSGTGRLNVTAFTPPPFTPGDFDQDGDVDGRDFMVWQRNTSVGNLADWQANYGTGTGPLTAGTTAVPEPTSIVLVAMAGLFVAARRRG